MEGKKSMLFTVPMIWCEPTSHHEDRYFCLMKIVFFEGQQNKIKYPYIPLMKPVPHEDDLSIPLPPTRWKEVSVLIEEKEDCMEGLSIYFNARNIPESCQEPYV
jgi:hypothetical protein